MATKTTRSGITYHAPNPLYYLLAVWGGGLIIIPSALGALVAGLGGHDQALAFAVISSLAWLFTGWLPALALFLIVWGISGWIGLGKIAHRETREFRSAYRAERELVQARDEQLSRAAPAAEPPIHVTVPQEISPSDQAPVTEAPTDPLPGNEESFTDLEWTEEAIWEHWREINTVGCCLDHADESGFPAHGGPDCRHPEIVRPH